MTPLATEAKRLWSAAFFYRRAPERDQTIAIRILTDLTQSRFSKIAGPARSLLEEIDHEQRARNN